MLKALPRLLISVLLAFCSVASSLRAGEPIKAPLSAPISVAELFAPPSTEPLLPPVVPPPPELQNPAFTTVPPVPAQPIAPAAEVPIPILPQAPPLASMSPGDRVRRTLKNELDLDWGVLSSEFVWRAPERDRDLPFERGEWSTADHFSIPVTGPLHLYTELALGGEYVADQTMTLTGKTGLMWKMPLDGAMPLEVRAGPTLKCTNPLQLQKAKDPSQQASMLWELKATAPLMGPIGMEFLGAAGPAATPDERSLLTQDVNLFVPISGGKVKLGAKHTWDMSQQEATRTSAGSMEWYLGIEIGR